MMFFHRHKGDLGEIRGGGEPRELRFCGSDGKQEGESERAAHAKRKGKRVHRESRRSVRDTIFTLRSVRG